MLEDVQEAVRASLEDVRRIALELRPEALDDLGLVSALAVLCERFAQRTGLEVAQRIDERAARPRPRGTSWSSTASPRRR